TRDRSRGLRPRPRRLAQLPPSPGRRSFLRRSDDRAVAILGADQRSVEPVPAELQDRASGRSGRRRRGRQSRAGRRPLSDSRWMAPARDPPLPSAQLRPVRAALPGYLDGARDGASRRPRSRRAGAGGGAAGRRVRDPRPPRRGARAWPRRRSARRGRTAQGRAAPHRPAGRGRHAPVPAPRGGHAAPRLPSPDGRGGGRARWRRGRSRRGRRGAAPTTRGRARGEARPGAAPGPEVKVVVVTTSYPRDEWEVAGVFVRDGVDALRAEGVEVDVVSPATVPHFGLAYGAGIPANLRREPWKAAFVPAFLASLGLAARRAAADADLVHAHWLPSGLAARVTGRPYVVQLWGTDAELAGRLPWIFRPAVHSARLALCASAALADAARSLGARDVALVPAGVPIPTEVGEPDEPPHALYVGRLSEEKGVLELAEAARDLPLVVVGDGPLRERLPPSARVVGLVPPADVGSFLVRVAVVVCRSRLRG